MVILDTINGLPRMLQLRHTTPRHPKGLPGSAVHVLKDTQDGSARIAMSRTSKGYAPQWRNFEDLKLHN